MIDDFEGRGPVTLTGSTGHHNAPQLLRITGDDPDNADDAYSDGDFVPHCPCATAPAPPPLRQSPPRLMRAASHAVA